jgi:hypothetical protein
MIDEFPYLSRIWRSSHEISECHSGNVMQMGNFRRTLATGRCGPFSDFCDRACKNTVSPRRARVPRFPLFWNPRSLLISSEVVRSGICGLAQSRPLPAWKERYVQLCRCFEPNLKYEVKLVHLDPGTTKFMMVSQRSKAN